MSTKAEIAARAKKYGPEHRDIIELALNILDRLDSLCLKGVANRDAVGIEIMELSDYIEKPATASTLEKLEQSLAISTTGHGVMFDTLDCMGQEGGQWFFPIENMKLVDTSDGDKALVFEIRIIKEADYRAKITKMLNDKLYSKAAIGTYMHGDVDGLMFFFKEIMLTNIVRTAKIGQTTYSCIALFCDQVEQVAPTSAEDTENGKFTRTE